MLEAWQHLISGDFMPHGHCYLWLPEILWTHVISDAVTAAAYYSIPISIVAFVRKRKDIDFKSIPVLFSAFIFLCGTTHIVAIVVVWTGYYGIQGMVKAATAIVSIFTAFFVWKLLPTLLAIPSRQQLNDKVNNATSELQDRNRQLAIANEDIESFVSAASHDLKEPLRTLVAYCQLLEKDTAGQLNEDAQADLGHIVSGARRMQALVNDILDLSSARHGDIDLQLIHLQDCVDDALKLVDGQLEESGARIEQADLPAVMGDRVLLTQVYRNLISNALKFTRDGQPPQLRITFETTPEGDRVFGVADNGIGVDPEFRSKIFEPFERLHGRDHSEGTGIGLAICKRAVERHGGEIWIDEVAGGGAHFKFTIRESSGEQPTGLETLEAQTSDSGR